MSTWQAQENPIFLGVWRASLERTASDLVTEHTCWEPRGTGRWRKMTLLSPSSLPTSISCPRTLEQPGSSAFGLGTELSHQLWPPWVSSFLTAGCGANSYIYLCMCCSSVCRTLTNNRGHCKDTKWMLQTMLINSTTLKNWINYLKIKICQNLSKMKWIIWIVLEPWKKLNLWFKSFLKEIFRPRWSHENATKYLK